MADKIQNEAWYNDSDLNQLLNFSLSSHKEVIVSTAMLGTDWHITDEKGVSHRGNELKSYLSQFQLPNNKSKVIIPLNLNINHWALLYIVFSEGRPGAVYYFDPKGSETHREVAQAIKQVYPHVEICNLPIQVQASSDSVNCGPWIVEAAKTLVEDGALPTCDIQQARENQEKILASIAMLRKSCSQLRELGLFNTEKRKATLKIINNEVVKNYVDNYLDSVNQQIDTATSEDELLAHQLQHEAIIEFIAEKKAIGIYL